MGLLAALLLASGIDAEAALRHASRLASLGPHPWGSTRTRFAADYVAAEFRNAGLSEVRLQPFESHGLAGANVLGVLRSAGEDFVVVGAHHDSAPEAPGAYDDGGGVGVLIETARVLAKRPRSRSIVFASFDGEEAWSTRKATTTGSRAYLASLGPRARHMTAAFVVEMCGAAGGSPVLHPIPYADPLRPGRYTVTPAWLVGEALAAARRAGVPLGLGDPLVPWLYQPALRTFRVGLYGDDLSFLQAGLPALFISDSSFSRYYPHYHLPSDTADKLDAASLGRTGAAVVAVVEALVRAGPVPAWQPEWFAAFGRVFGRETLLLAGALSVLPGLVMAFGRGPRSLRLAQAALFGVVLWRHPVPALWVFLLPNLLLPLGRAWLSVASLLPLGALAGLGLAAWARGMVAGLWFSVWEIAVAGAALLLLFAPRPKTRGLPRTGPRKGPRR